MRTVAPDLERQISCHRRKLMPRPRIQRPEPATAASRHLRAGRTDSHWKAFLDGHSRVCARDDEDLCSPEVITLTDRTWEERQDTSIYMLAALEEAYRDDTTGPETPLPRAKCSDGRRRAWARHRESDVRWILGEDAAIQSDRTERVAGEVRLASGFHAGVVLTFHTNVQLR
jgi:hypothetical protein